MEHLRILSENGGERVWVTPITKNRFKLENIPFFSPNLALHDIVLGEAPNADEYPIFKRVVKRSGNSTIQVAVNPDYDNQALDLLKAIGLSFECAVRPYYVGNVPAGTDLNLVNRILKIKEKEGVYRLTGWSYRFRKH